MRPAKNEVKKHPFMRFRHRHDGIELITIKVTSDPGAGIELLIVGEGSSGSVSSGHISRSVFSERPKPARFVKWTPRFPPQHCKASLPMSVSQHRHVFQSIPSDCQGRYPTNFHACTHWICPNHRRAQWCSASHRRRK